MPKVTFVTQSSRLSDDPGYDPSRLVNVYAEVGPEGGKGPVLLRSVPGYTTFATTASPEMRAMEFFNNRIYAISGAKLFEITEAGVVTESATVRDDVNTTISNNGSDITMSTDGDYFVWDGVNLTMPINGRLSAIGSVAHLDHYTILTERDGDEFEWTTLADPTSRNALFFATNESKSDKTLRVLSDRLYLWFFGTESTEVWYNTGASDQDAFVRISGGALESGILAANLAVKTETGLFYIGDDRVAYVTNGATPTAISTATVNQALEGETPTHCFYYEDRGHRFCCIRFDNRPAWIYDMSTGLWHERSSGVNGGAWDIVAMVHAWNRYYGAKSDGTIYEMSRTNTDITTALVRKMVSSSLYLDGEQFSVSELEFLGRFGEEAAQPTLMFRISKDGGRAFGPIKTLDGSSRREIRTVLRALGRYRNFVIELTITDPLDVNIYSQANVRIG